MPVSGSGYHEPVPNASPATHDPGRHGPVVVAVVDPRAARRQESAGGPAA